MDASILENARAARGHSQRSFPIRVLIEPPNGFEKLLHVVRQASPLGSPRSSRCGFEGSESLLSRVAL